MFKKIGILLFAFLHSFCLYSQECGNCKVTPIVATYDFNINVPRVEPGKPGWLEFLQLHWLSAHANAYLFAKNKDCVRFMLAPSSEKELNSDYDIEKIGLGHLRLPHPDFRDHYITTGNITKGANGYNLHMELLAACSRKVIASVDEPFQGSVESQYILGVAHKAAARLNIVQNINRYELAERGANSSFALGGSDRDRIKLTPAKTKLQRGETTDINIDLKDCDGAPLANRLIVFDANDGENKIPGTVGGTVTPSSIITDSKGKAVVKFKMTAAAGSPAIVNAHTITATSLNCKDAFIGSTQIDPGVAIKVQIDFEKKTNERYGLNSNEDGIAFKADHQQRSHVQYSMTAFYYPKSASIDNKQVMIVSDEAMNASSNEEVEEEEQKETDIPGLVPYMSQSSMDGKAVMYYFGFSEFRSSDNEIHLEASPLGAPPPPGVRTKNIISYKPVMPTMSFLFKNKELVFFSAGVEYETSDESGSLSGGSFGIEIGNKKYFPVKGEKITDPGSPYKFKYTLVYDEVTSYDRSGTVYNASNAIEKATVIIYTPF